MTELAVKRPRGRPKGSTKAPRSPQAPELTMRRGVIARDKFGHLGLVTAGPTPIFIGNELRELWTGIHLHDHDKVKVGSGWTSFTPTPVLDLENLK